MIAQQYPEETRQHRLNMIEVYIGHYILANGQKPYSDGETKAYETVMKELNFSKEMFDYLNLSKSRSEELVLL